MNTRHARLVGARTVQLTETFATQVRRLRPDQLASVQTRARTSGRVFERDGYAIYAFGTAARIELPNGLGDTEAAHEVTSILREIALLDEDDQAPEGPLAFAAFPFARVVRSHLIIPRIAVLVDHNDSLAIISGPRAELDAIYGQFVASINASPEQSHPPDHFELVSTRSHRSFLRLVSNATAAIENGEFEKVVLAREVSVTGNRAFHQRDLLERLRALHPSCITFGIDGFVGASPELLCRRQGASVWSHPLAGTVARSGDPIEDARLAELMLASTKERSEHRLVVDAITAGLEPYCESLSVPETPHLLDLRNVTHLATPIEGRLKGETDWASALDLVSVLHPTPAVAGAPREAALAYLAKCEELDRSHYAGPVGWMRANGDGEWWIGIRSAIVRGETARLFAGVGIVAGSVPEAELAETQLKLQALLAAAVRP